MVVNWNTAASAVAAARQIARSDGVRARVTVVDNDSLPDQRDLLREEAGDAFRLIESPTNLGFGAAANLGLRETDADFILVSNADISAEPGTVATLAAAAGGRKDSGMVGPVFGNGGDIYHDHLPGATTLLARTVIGGFGRHRLPMPEPGAITEVEQPSGACFLMTHDAWSESGGFDDGFFLWYEDVDLARRLHDSGRTGLVVGSARVEHIGGKSFARLDESTKQAIRLDSLERYIRLHHAGAAPLAKPLLWFSRRLRVKGEVHPPGTGPDVEGTST